MKQINLRPLSPSMQQMLLEAFSREQLKQSPLGISYSQSCKGLVLRGMMSFDPYKHDGKIFMGFHLTAEGKEFVELYLHKKQNS